MIRMGKSIRNKWVNAACMLFLRQRFYFSFLFFGVRDRDIFIFMHRTNMRLKPKLMITNRPMAIKGSASPGGNFANHDFHIQSTLFITIMFVPSYL